MAELTHTRVTGADPIGAHAVAAYPAGVGLSGARWRTSTRSSSNGGDCVEVADNLPDVVAVRDSKDPAGPVLTFSPAAWRTFLGRARQLTA